MAPDGRFKNKGTGYAYVETFDDTPFNKGKCNGQLEEITIWKCKKCGREYRNYNIAQWCCR